MADGREQEQETTGEASASDDDSVSLLWNLDACQSKVAAEDVEPEMHRLKAPESAAQIVPCLKIPNKGQLHRRNGWGETLLHKACKTKHLAQVMALIQAGISVNTEDHGGWTALHEASVVGDKAVVEELLKAGAMVNMRSFDGVTPLHDAVVCGHYQVVKLLLQHGSYPSDRTVGGLSALDMAEEEDIREMLLTFQTLCTPAQSREAGDASSAVHCQSSISTTKADVQSRESGDRDGAREPGDIQRKKDATADNRSPSEAVTLVLEEVRRKQTEAATWPLACPEDAGRFQAALTQIQNMLTEVLAKQQQEKDKLAHTGRVCLWKRMLKSQLAPLASRQRTLVEILQDQMHLEELYVAMKTRGCTSLPSGPKPVVVRQQPDHLCTPASIPSSSGAGEGHSCDPDRQRKKRQRPVRQTSLSRSAPLNPAKDVPVPRPPAPSRSLRKKIPTRRDEFHKKQSCRPQPGNTPQHVTFQKKSSNAVIRTTVEDKSKHLLKLVQRGALPSGSTLQLLLKVIEARKCCWRHTRIYLWQRSCKCQTPKRRSSKSLDFFHVPIYIREKKVFLAPSLLSVLLLQGRRHLADVLYDGSIKDCRGRRHKSPEHWLESILDNNIPVSSAFAWDKVMFRDRPLAHYLLNTGAEAEATQTRPADDGRSCRARPAREKLLTDEASLKHLMKIKTIHLPTDENFLPNAVLDGYWEELLQKEASDWGDA